MATSRPPRASISLAALLIAALPLAAVPLSHAAGTGAWTSAQDWSLVNGTRQIGKQAVHMLLSRGDGSPFHSRLFFWDTEQSGTLAGGEWGWKPTSDGCASFGNFTALPVNLSGVDLFCAGMTPLADGRVFIPGGTSHSTGQYGENKSRIYTPGADSTAGTWFTPPLMTEYRWYPSATTLEDGRAIVLSGSKHPNHRVFGGRSSLSSPPAPPNADSVRRFAPVEDGLWDPAVVPGLVNGSTRPPIRERHTAVEMKEVFTGEVVFGGLDSVGTRLNDTFILRRYNNVTGSDYAYKWEKITPFTSTQFVIPSERSEHTAVSVTSRSEMVMYGGLPTTGPSTTVSRFFRSGGQYKWQAMNVSGSANPSPAGRYGHASCYEEIYIDSVLTKRMLMFGGRTTTGGAPTDTCVWALTFNPDEANHPNEATWSNITPIGPHPSARRNHTLIADPLIRPHTGDNLRAHASYLFGGCHGDTTYSNELWILWTFENGSVAWEQRNYVGAPDSTGVPSARARHAATYDGKEGEGGGFQRGRVYIFGGENAAGVVDKHVYVIDPWRTISTPTWEAWAEADVALTGHTMTKEHLYEVTLARLPEVYSPGSDTWQPESNSKLLQDPYPPTFTAPHPAGAGPRVVSMGLDSTLYWLNLPTSGAADSAWHPFPNGKLDFFTSTQAVMYRPGQIMMAGGHVDTISVNPTTHDTSIVEIVGPGTTMTLDVSNTSNNWQTSAPMQRRNFHNLVLLPNGQVLAVGGVNTIEDFDVSDAVAVRRPQMWNPEAGTNGTWTAQSDLAEQSMRRNYHSTAVLMPDGRVVSASGHIDVNKLHEEDQYYAEIYCPPYLFEANGTTLATRPTLVSATGRMRYNKGITFAVSGDTALVSPRRVCLLRAPSTTHGFDQSQRYVPLTIETRVQDEIDTNVWHYFATAPADSSIAPPGDYMLFASNAAGVPAIAQWIRVGPAYTGMYDTVAPDAITIDIEFISSNALYPYWSAPGDNGAIGTALDYDLRWSTSTLNSTNFGSATRVPNLPIPWAAGAVQRATLSGLSSGTWYHFADKTRDKAENWSLLSADVKFKTLTAGGGGGFAAQRTSGEGSSGSSAPASATKLRFAVSPNAALPSGSHVRLVAEFAKGDPMTWVLRKVDTSSDKSLGSIPATQLAIQADDTRGGWRTRSAFTPEPGPLGVRSLAHAGRVVFPEGVELDAVETDPARFSCSGATSSRLGDLTAATPELTGDDVVTLDYSSRSTQGTGDDCFFTVLIPGEGLASNTRGLPTADPATPSPKVFAFMPVRPNPIQSSALLRFSLDTPGAARFEIFDAGGRRVRVLAGDSFGAGEHELTWDGRDSGGARVRPGIYLVRLTAGPHRTERKVALLP